MPWDRIAAQAASTARFRGTYSAALLSPSRADLPIILIQGFSFGRNLMSRFIGVIFQDEEAATEALHALKEFEVTRSIAVSGTAMVEKDEKGAISARRVTDEGSIAALVGALIGGLAGLAGGPVGGAIAAAGGAIVGRAADRINLGEREKFATKVSQSMSPGSIAVLAEVTEYSESALDLRMQELGGILIRE
jgi:uncharacterized membrane protein